MGFRYPDELDLPEPAHVTETVVQRLEHVFEVDPALMREHVAQQAMLRWDTERIVAARWDYLDWMHHHFARRVVHGSSLFDDQ
jgi:hypothetical protein